MSLENFKLKWDTTTQLFNSVLFSGSVVSDSLWPHGLQHARPPCPSTTPRVYSNSCPIGRWCHPTSQPWSSPSPSAFNLSQHQDLFQSVSSSHQGAKVLELQLQHQSFQRTQDWSPLGWAGWTSLQSKGLSRVFSKTTVQKHQLKKKFKTPCDPAIPLLGIYPEETKTEKDTWTRVFSAALFTIAGHGSNLDVHQQMNG